MKFDLRRSEERVTHLYRPIWLAMYTYGGANYVFASDGVTDRTTGTRPEDTGLRSESESLDQLGCVMVGAGILLCWTIVVPLVILGYYFITYAPRKAAYRQRVEAARAAREAAAARAGRHA